MTTLDERIEAARKLEGYTPGPWECFHGLQTDNWHSAVYGPAGDYDALLVAVCNQNDSHRADTVLIAAAPDLHRLVLDIAAEHERLLAICRDVPGALNAAFAAGIEECEGGSTRRQEKALVPVDEMRKRIRAALNQETVNV